MYLCPQPTTLKLEKGMLYFPVGEMPEVKKTKPATLFEKESYRIIINENGVLIEGADDAGLYYGELTLRQIMLNYRGCLPYLYLYDEPRYSYRGFMIDPCRHFFTVDEIKRMIDGAAYFKFNKFHFHLSDDQGFRAEIESYPLLTTVGSVRPSSNFGRGENDENPYGGYYTKKELREIVEYCKERHIEVIPEFDIPGHTTSVIAAYPELSCRGEKIEPKTCAGIFDDILCAGNDDTYKLIEAVIDELCEIFTGKYFHIGGD
jgi:hexosaminidase